MLSSGVTDIADALHRLPGVNIRDYGGAGGMKTVSVRGLGATHTGLIYDGLPVSDSQNGYVDFSRYQPQNLQSLSLIVGDDNDIAGTATEAASAATVRMVSAAAAVLGGEKQSMLSAFVRAGSFGMVNPSFCAAKSIGVNSSASLAVDYMHAVNDYPFTLVNGTVTTRERRNNSRMNAVRSEADWAWKATAGVEASAKVYYYHNGRRLPGAVTLYNPESHERLLERNFGMPRAIAMNRQAMPEASSTTATISDRRLPALRLCGVSTAIGAHQLLPTTITVHCGAAVDTATTPAAAPS